MRERTMATEQWGLFEEGRRRADVAALRARFAFDCIYYRRGGTANWRWCLAPLNIDTGDLERAGYPCVPGRIEDGPPRQYAVDGWDDIRMRRI